TRSKKVEKNALPVFDVNGDCLYIHRIVIVQVQKHDLKTMLIKNFINNQAGERTIFLYSAALLVEFYISCGFTVTGNMIQDKIEMLYKVHNGLGVVQVDAFATQPYQGNPAAVVVLSPKQFNAPNAAQMMQKIALEMNLSETAFVSPKESGIDYNLRWFKPAKEVDICGHATLAAAFTLYTDKYCAKDQPIRFHTRSGILTTRHVTLDNGHPGIMMDFPASKKILHEKTWYSSTQTQLLQAFQLTSSCIIAIEQYGSDIICQVDPAAFARVTIPDSTKLIALDCRATILTCVAPSTSGYDYFCRFFGPRNGINEDPVTGSAQCALVPYYSNFLSGQTSFCCRQKSARGGDIHAQLVHNRVILYGPGVMTLRGTLNWWL
ncbi:hypothetical protein THRCLA_09047, partial [Thraustotheca clavata]